ncbi:MAG: hypothetical protein CMD02_02310 [Flavobacteriales bacterium]|nr:hypothetical protein [Flavobacteriales bacterium]|tara:strand:- start:2757 stop:3734 length:978 start_codon:yes stop_codon:yes gene_type:complete
MKKDNFISLLLFTSLIFLYGCKNENFKQKDFAISDRNNVSKIIMKDKSGNSILLKKNNNSWTINNKYKVWQRQIDYTLKVMEDIRIKSSVSEKKIDYVIKNIATTGVKIEIFQDNERIRSYYIGGNTKDYQGTYMMVEGSETAYIMHIPDRNPGILNPKFGIEGTQVNENIWRAPAVIDYSKNDIKKIVCEDIIMPEQSFTVDLENKSLYNFKGQKVVIDKTSFSYWNLAFEDLKCGVYKPNLEKSDFALVKKIHITTKFTTDSLFIYNKTKIQSTKKEFNSSVEYKYSSFNNSDLFIIQNNIFNKVLITLEEFLILNGEKPQSL